MPALATAEADVASDIKSSLTTIRQLVADDPKSPSDGIRILRTIRDSEYENLNQLQHRWLIIQARRWLEHETASLRDATWEWNPEQTGTGSEPDLRASVDAEVKVSAEATTSKDPIGSIDTRMKATLAKLSKMEGALYYFAVPDSMANRARTKINKDGWSIAVVQIQD